MAEIEPNEPAKKVDPYLLRLRLESRLKLNIITPEEKRQLQDLVNGTSSGQSLPDKEIVKTGVNVPEQDNKGPKPIESLMKSPSGQTPKNPL
jgi:hypothetical protein